MEAGGGLGRGSSSELSSGVSVIDGKRRRLMVIVDRPRVGSQQGLGQSNPEITRGAGLSTLGWESGPGSVLWCC